MNDEFMKQFLEEPRTEFADALYKRISQQTQSRFAEKIQNKLTLRNSAILFALLFFIAACVYAVSEKQQEYKKIGEIWVFVQKTQKIKFLPNQVDSHEDHQTQPLGGECMTIAEAKEALGFDFQISTWWPEGFTFNGMVCDKDPVMDIAHLYWVSEDKYSSIQFTITGRRMYNPTKQKYEINPASIGSVAPGSYKEVQVHGQPAVLVQGDWDLNFIVSEVPPDGEFDVRWDKKLALQLYWFDEEVAYHLYTRTDISAKDLIKMAESAR